jgi:hypothetical protein
MITKAYLDPRPCLSLGLYQAEKYEHPFIKSAFSCDLCDLRVLAA